MSLYDDDIAQGLLNAHIRAVQGHLPSRLRTRLYRLFNIVEAPRTLLIPKGLRWPSWCKDLPCAQTVIQKSEPICSVESEASSPGHAIQLLMQRMRILEDLIGARQQSLHLPHPI
jgi:predicted ATP-grasp superfamily ATP-dependent carboligase